MDPWSQARRAAAAIAAEWHAAPYAAQLGIVVILLGTAGDVVAHAVQSRPAAGFTVPQQTAHLVILFGMILTLAGVVLPGGRSAGRGRGGHSKEVERVPRDR